MAARAGPPFDAKSAELETSTPAGAGTEHLRRPRNPQGRQTAVLELVGSASLARMFGGGQRVPNVTACASPDHALRAGYTANGPMLYTWPTRGPDVLLSQRPFNIASFQGLTLSLLQRCFPSPVAIDRLECA